MSTMNDYLQLDKAVETARLVLAAAVNGGTIAETPLGTPTLSDWQELTANEREALLTWPQTKNVMVAELEGQPVVRKERPSKQLLLEAACKLAGTTYKEARGRMIDDVIAAARRKTGGQA